jgi:hypothetical protein
MGGTYHDCRQCPPVAGQISRAKRHNQFSARRHSCIDRYFRYHQHDKISKVG